MSRAKTVDVDLWGLELYAKDSGSHDNDPTFLLAISDLDKDSESSDELGEEGVPQMRDNND